MKRRAVPALDVPPKWHVLDIGPRTIESFAEHLRAAGTVLRYGPPGAVETKPFDVASLTLARNLSEIAAPTLVTGSETASAAKVAGAVEGLNHVIEEGSALLAMLRGEQLPAVAALDDAPPQ